MLTSRNPSSKDINTAPRNEVFERENHDSHFMLAVTRSREARFLGDEHKVPVQAADPTRR